MKTYQLPFIIAFPAAGLGAALFALVSGFFCVRLIKLYFAMLTLAFSQIIWAIAYKWNDVTGVAIRVCRRRSRSPISIGMSSIPGLGSLRTSDQFYILTVFSYSRRGRWRYCIGWCARPSAASSRRSATTRSAPPLSASTGGRQLAWRLSLPPAVLPGFAPARCTASSAAASSPIGVFWSEIGRSHDRGDPRRHELFLGPAGGRLWPLVWLNQEIHPLTPSIGRSCSARCCWCCCLSFRAVSSAVSTCCGHGRGDGFVA